MRRPPFFDLDGDGDGDVAGARRAARPPPDYRRVRTTNVPTTPLSPDMMAGGVTT